MIKISLQINAYKKIHAYTCSSLSAVGPVYLGARHTCGATMKYMDSISSALKPCCRSLCSSVVEGEADASSSGGAAPPPVLLPRMVPLGAAAAADVMTAVHIE